MNTNRNKKLALRAHSIRILTAAELGVAQGGVTCTHSHQTVPTLRTQTTHQPPPPPPTTVKA
jgi:hypothetical protein